MWIIISIILIIIIAFIIALNSGSEIYDKTKEIINEIKEDKENE